MKNYFWASVLFASVALAAPGKGTYGYEPPRDASTRSHMWSGSNSYSLTDNSSRVAPTCTDHGSSRPSTIVTTITTIYTTGCPATQTNTIDGSTLLSTYQMYSTVTEFITSTITVTPQAPAATIVSNGDDSPASVGIGTGNGFPDASIRTASTAVTEITTVYTTICPVTATAILGKTTVTKTYETTSFITSVFTSTITLAQSQPLINDGPAAPTGSVSWVTVPWGSTTFKYTVPLSWTNSKQRYGSSAPSTAASYATATKGPSSESNTILSSGTGSISTGSHPFPTRSPSVPAQNTTIWSPSGTGVRSSAAPSYPAGNSSSWGPTGTSPPHNVSSTSNSSCTRPTPTLTSSCVRCEGQPGNDQFCGYTEDDDWYQVMPKTCNTVEYHFNVENKTISPDGIPRVGLVVNGQMPGPTIHASWGDTIIVHLTSSMQDNGTSIHFHGMRQYWTNEMDGVPSITQCALAPGDTFTYTFKATNYGTSWYHSHFAIQTYDGVFGPIVIDGPTSQHYDDEQSIILQDWNHITVDTMYDAAQTFPTGGPRTLDTGLINGMNLWGMDGSANATGQRFQMTVSQGKTYRLRLVNVAIQSTFKFYIDNHKFTVFANDFVPIEPYEATILNINIGQRYDILLKADQPIGNYWMRSDNQDVCARITYATNIKGIVNYVGAAPGIPTSKGYDYIPECVDEPYASLVPRVPLNAGATADKTIEEEVLVGPNDETPNLYKWTLSGTTFQSQWGEPTLQGIVNNASFDVQTYSGDLAITAPNLGEWIYIIIDSPIPVPHPIHLHGHDFLILAQGPGMYSSDVQLNLINPPRRDVALMPWSPATGEGGHLVLAFQVDNPGVWLVHCHIGWHVAMGFALQIIEAEDQIKKTVTDSCQLDKTCSKWRDYAKGSVYDVVVNDSGV